MNFISIEMPTQRRMLIGKSDSITSEIHSFEHTLKGFELGLGIRACLS